MIIKLTLVGLIIVLVAVIALSYYNNREFFEDITNQLNSICDSNCESGIQSKDGSAILIMVKKLNPKDQKDLNPYSTKDRDSITGSLLLQTKSDNGSPQTVWRAIPCDKGANPPYTANVTNNGRLVIKNNADKEVWASSKGPVPNGFARYQLTLVNKMDKKGPTDQLQIIDPLGISVWSASSPDSPDSFKPCDSQPMPMPMPMPDPRRRPRKNDDPDSSDPSTGSMPDRTDITPDNQMSDTGSVAAALKYKSDLLKDLQKVVRNELIANRMTKQLERDDDEDHDSDAMAQGREYGCHRQDTYRCPKNPDGSCPPVPDMSDYIKKDSIPCFGCSLDY